MWANFSVSIAHARRQALQRRGERAIAFRRIVSIAHSRRQALQPWKILRIAQRTILFQSLTRDAKPSNHNIVGCLPERLARFNRSLATPSPPTRRRHCQAQVQQRFNRSLATPSPPTEENRIQLSTDSVGFNRSRATPSPPTGMPSISHCTALCFNRSLATPSPPTNVPTKLFRVRCYVSIAHARRQALQRRSNAK